MYLSLGFRIPRYLTATLGLAIGLLVLGSATQAQAKTTAPSKCSYPKAEQVFAPWSDNGYYELAPDGGLEAGGTGWSFTGGAQIVSGNEDKYLNSAEDQAALSLPYGSTATSPQVCVDATTPTFRLMTLNSGNEHTKLRVTVAYESSKGGSSRVVEFRANGQWQPTEPLQLDTDGETERVARISFTPSERGGDWLVDDLYIDPFARR